MGQEDLVGGRVDPDEAAADQGDLEEEMAEVMDTARCTRFSRECRKSRREPAGWRKRGTRIKTAPGIRRT